MKEFIYGGTVFAVMVFGLWEMKVKRDLTAEELSIVRRQGFHALPGSIRENIRKETILKGLPDKVRKSREYFVWLNLVF